MTGRRDLTDVAIEGENKWISITHFINPYQFWYCSIDEKSNVNVQSIEEELTKYCKKHRNEGPEISVGSEIAVDLLSLNKYIRARVEEVLHVSNKVSYIVWAIDRGYPFVTKAQYCRPLPTQFNAKIERIFWGGIEKIVPAEKAYDFDKQKTITISREKWCTRACISLENLLDDAAHIEFLENCNIRGHNWGDLLIYNHRGKVVRASEFLVHEEVAVKSVEQFKKRFLYSQRINIPKWQTNDGNHKFAENISARQYFPYFDLDEEKCELNDVDFLRAKFKVDAWNAFNKNAIEKPNKNDIFVENSDMSLDSSTDKDAESFCESINKLAIDDPKEYVSTTKKLTPEPTLADFCVLEENSLVDKPTINAFSSLDTSSVYQTGSLVDSEGARGRSHLLNNLRVRSERARRQQSKQQSDLIQKSPKNPQMLPVGFDLANLNEYKKKDHWHCKKTTQNHDTSSDNSTYKDAESVCESKRSLARGEPKLFRCAGKKLAPKPTLADFGVSEENLIESNPSTNASISFDTSSVFQTTSLVDSEDARASSYLLNNQRIRSMRARSQQSEQQQSATIQKTRRNIAMIPAGFDITRLNKYKNKDHWHRKTTTRNERYPHKPESDNQT